MEWPEIHLLCKKCNVGSKSITVIFKRIQGNSTIQITIKDLINKRKVLKLEISMIKGSGFQLITYEDCLKIMLKKIVVNYRRPDERKITIIQEWLANVNLHGQHVLPTRNLQEVNP